MNQLQIAYLRARELESFFREKVDLQYKGQTGRFSEYEVTQVNNRPVRAPITVGIAEASTGAKLYLSADLTKTSQGTAKVDFDLSRKMLHGLETGRHKIIFLDALQTAVSNRYLTNAEDISGQSLLRSVNREYQKTILNPFHQLRDIFRLATGTIPGGPFGKPLGDTVKQAKPIHIIRNAHFFGRTNFGLWNSAKQSREFHTDTPSSPIIVRPDTQVSSIGLSSKQDYELSFSRDSHRGIPHSKCTFTPVNNGHPENTPMTVDYDGLRLTDRGLELYLGSDQTIALSYSDRIRAHDRREPGSNPDHLQKQSISPDRNEPSKEAERRSLDSMIASAQVRAREQSIKTSVQKNRTVFQEPDR